MFIFLGLLFQDLKLIFYILTALIIVTIALYIVGRLLISLLGFINFINSKGWKIEQEILFKEAMKVFYKSSYLDYHFYF